MINLDDFEKFDALKPFIEKINKNYAKNKKDKIPKLLVSLSELMDQELYLVPITYILSLIAENEIDLISNDIISKAAQLLEGKDNKVRLNSVTVLGFSMLKNPKLIDTYLVHFIKLLNDE